VHNAVTDHTDFDGGSDAYHRYSGFDIIGDIHGCGTTLKALLERLGYQKKAGIYQHASRQALFVGDVVDRGPHIRQALSIVYDMVSAGHAQMVMGNHEYNAICYMTPAPAESGHTFLREHTPHHNRLIAETLEQFANHREDWSDYLQWFSELPLFMETQAFRVVHACWDSDMIAQYRERYGSNRISLAVINESVQKGSFASIVTDRLMRGTDIKLPDKQVIRSRDGHERRFFRTKFWAKKPATYADVVFQPDPLPDTLIERVLTKKEKKRLSHYGENERPLFFGHYWLQGRPMPVRNNLACLDYSAVKYGRLVAYRMDGEQQLDPSKFVWVYVNTPEYEAMKSATQHSDDFYGE